MYQVHKAKWILASNGVVIENGAVVVEDGKIVLVTGYKDLDGLQGIISVVDHKNAVITAGFINLHSHLQYTDLVKDKHTNNHDFSGWVIDLIKKYSALNSKEKVDSVKAGSTYASESGTTTLVQLAKDDIAVDTYKQLPLRTYLFFETFSNNQKSSLLQFNELEDKLDRYKEYADDQLHFGISPHSVYNVHEDLWRRLSDFSLDNNVLIHTHLAESFDEMSWIKGEDSNIKKLHSFVGWSDVKPSFIAHSPVEYLEKIGVLNENLIVAHLNQLDIEDFETLSKHDVKIAFCPRSNVFLHGGTLDIEKVLGIMPFENVGIGTDSLFSNLSLSLLDEARFIKSHTSLGLLKIIDMLTINAAKILKLDQNLGSLEKGKYADFIVFKLSDDQTYQNILDKAKPDKVFVEGKQVYGA